MGPLFLQPAITGERKTVWVLLVIALPLLGSLGWLFLGRPAARRQLAASDRVEAPLSGEPLGLCKFLYREVE